MDKTRSKAKRISELVSTVEGALKTTRDVERRSYDGVLGTLPNWVPVKTSRDFSEYRWRLLNDGYTPEQILGWMDVIESRICADNSGSIVAGHVPRDVRRDVEELWRIRHYVSLGKQGKKYLDPDASIRGGKGGAGNKKLTGVLALLEAINEENPRLKFPEVWGRIPEGENAALLNEYEIYRDGDSVIQVSSDGHTRTIKKKSLRTGYWSSIKKRSVE